MTDWLVLLHVIGTAEANDTRQQAEAGKLRAESSLQQRQSQPADPDDSAHIKDLQNEIQRLRNKLLQAEVIDLEKDDMITRLSQMSGGGAGQQVIPGVHISMLTPRSKASLTI